MKKKSLMQNLANLEFEYSIKFGDIVSFFALAGVCALVWSQLTQLGPNRTPSVQLLCKMVLQMTCQRASEQSPEFWLLLCSHSLQN